ncbi:type I-E CRISPR-associated protein Cas5/CasD [Rhodococcus sp. IEGM 1366]|uniref:type I-E CRISPR-associated protein Cas5/CasD n=1 Tax=Rhodococcus sp. IEGM 1366 TaxID=3082223 RepID=UPI0029544F1E|nr:type I-E CRISPR-associated protein Cas5/CasD [Rhodococcus sp. IEGM 1366]MDV8071120.1 type I-E CRISPR-associated protein Cas5/CasD [Rhodococcus sp. IEGM 1366]
MTTLLLKLSGPMQAWGAASRFSQRNTRQEPTKSGVVGLLAAAQGRRRTDPLEDLAALKFGVRVDQPGQLIRDFQTAKSLDDKRTMPLSYRYYLGDAVFVAGVEGDSNLVGALAEALRNPTFPLYLGRRSCPPSGPLRLNVSETPLMTALESAPWEAANWYRTRQGKSVHLRIAIDAVDGEIGELVRDIPISFDPTLREYGWRNVIEHGVNIENPKGRANTHDVMAALGGA